MGSSISPAPASGGDSNNLGTVSTEPSSPTDDEYWNLTTAEAVTTWGIADLASQGEISINLPTPLISDITTMYAAPTATDITPLPMTIVFTDNATEEVVGGDGANILAVSYSASSTNATMVTLLNIWSQAEISKNIATLNGTALNFQTSIIDNGPPGGDFTVTSDFSAESVKAKVQHNGSTYSTTLTKEA